jgi:hypothetical protein
MVSPTREATSNYYKIVTKLLDADGVSICGTTSRTLFETKTLSDVSKR